ncbi:MAG: outer membrane protein assembly factor BamA [Verrucomicrobiota bacterium]|nr:outer membrane protein assembly factor BamA [Verrucomicrobiota bacterium]
MSNSFGSARRRFTQFFLVLVTALSAQAQSQPEGQPTSPPIIRAIDVQFSGPATMSRDKVLSLLRTHVGDPYSETVAEQDVKSLYESGAVGNVRMYGQVEDNGGVRVIVALQTRPILREIEVDGVHKFSSGAIRKKIEVKLNTPVDEKKLELGRQEIVTSYRAHGFNDIDVQFRIEPMPGSKAEVRAVYTVNEGAKGALSEVRFEGNEHIKASVLRKQMKTRKKTLISFLDKTGRVDETQLQEDLDKIRAYYQNHGYADVVIRDARRDRTSSGRLQLVIVIDEGPIYHLGKIDYVGYKSTTDAKIRGLVKLRSGDIYSPEKIKADGKLISDSYGVGGFVDLNIIPQTSAGKNNTIDVTYKIEEGQRAFVQRVLINGNTRTKDKVIRREVLIAPGDIYNTVRVDVSKKRLDNLGFFAKVDTYPIDTGVEGRKDLEIQVEEKRTGSLNFGGGFSTVDSLLAFVELTQGNFDIANYPSFIGGGQKFRIRIQLGTQRKDAEVSLTEPWFLDRPISLGGSIFYHESNYLSSVYDQRNYGASWELRKSIGAYTYASLGYRVEGIEIYNIAGGISQLLTSELGNSSKSQFTLGFVFDRRDNPFFTHQGERFSLTTYVSGGPLGGSSQVYGFDLEAAKYYRLPLDMVLLINSEIASVDGWGKYDRVGIYDLLFLGGSNNLRGFDFRDVGPRDHNGQPLGGRTLARGTVELTFPIIEKVRGAFFYDAGYVHSAAFDFGTTYIASDFGIGVRLDLPIGPLRIDYGFPIQKEGTSGGGKFNFNVGYQF